MIDDMNLPQPSAEFDKKVRNMLNNLPERRAKRRFTAGRVAAIALAAALCLGGGALAVNGGLFPLLFPDGGEAVGDYVQTPAGAVDENGDYRLSVEGVLFDESTGAGLISLKLEDKSGEGGAPFTLGETFKEYRRPGIAWSRLTECFAAPDAGQYGFIINTADQGGVGGRFYVDTERSADGVWYVEGAFIAGEDYAGEALRVDMTAPGAEAPALSVALPEFETLPHISSADGNVTLSAVGLTIADNGMFVVDEAEYIALRLADGTVQVIEDEAGGVDRTLYALGSMDGETGTYVLSFAPELENVRSVIVNDIEYMVK